MITPDQEIFTIAGLWEKWKSPTGEDIYSFTLITQEPNGVVAYIHNRMPAILTKDQEQLWLDPEVTPSEAVQMLLPYPEEHMESIPCFIQSR